MINLGRFRYRNVLSKFGGPISDISVFRVVIDNVDYFQANSYLIDSLKMGVLPLNVYGTCDGSGTSVNKNVAVAKSISEAMERWAFYQLKQQINSYSLYGFDLDPTTNGFAAFPGLFNRTCRHQSSLEAMEKWALIEWGEKKLPLICISSFENYKIYVIVTPSPILKVVLIAGKVGNIYSYGFACDNRQDCAIEKAKIEYFRNINVLKKYLSKQNAQIETGFSKFERRLIWYSSDDGHCEFQKIVLETLDKKFVLKEPKIIIDKEITGPWSKYANVWRKLYEVSNHNYLSDKVNVFFF